MEKKTERLINLVKQAQNEFAENYLVLAIPGFLTKKFVAYCSMKEDIELILEYIKLLRNDNDHVIKSSLSYAMISLYGKCFTDASKNSYPKLEPNDIFKNQEKFAKTHEYLIDLRHQFIAHRGETDSEIGIAFMIIPKKEGVDKTQLRFSQLKQNSFSNDNLNEFESLMNFIHDNLMEKIQKSGQKLHEGYLKMFQPEEIVQMLMNNAK